MGCAVDAYRASIGLFGPTLLVILNKGAKKAARLWKQRKLQSTMAMLAALTLLSLLVRGGVEQNPGPEFDQAMDKLYSRIESRLSQAEGRITFQTMEEMQRQINSVMKQHQRQSRDITQSLKNGHQSLHTEIQRVHTQVTHLSDTVEENREKITNIAEDQCRTAEKLQKLESEIERLESFSRRNNLRFFNIPQPTNETDDDCTRTLVRTLNHFYPSKRWNEDDIERAHRTGSTASNGRRPRPIIARFFSWRDKMLVLRDREARRRMGDRDMRVADDLTNNQHARLQKEREDGRHAYYKNGRLHTEVRQQNPNAARRVQQHEHRDNNLRGGSLRSSSRDARGDERNEPHQSRYDQHNGPRHGGDDRTVYNSHYPAREFGRVHSPKHVHYRDYSPPRRDDRHFTFPDRDFPHPPQNASRYFQQQRHDGYYPSHNDRNDRDRRARNHGECQHQSRATVNVGHSFHTWNNRREGRDGRPRDEISPTPPSAHCTNSTDHAPSSKNGRCTHDRSQYSPRPPRRDTRRSRSPRDRTYAEELKDNGTSPGTNIWDNVETAMENNSASSRDPASLEAEVIFSPTPQYSDSGETPAETPAHDCGNDAAARENSDEANKEDTAHSVNTRSRSRSALLTAAHSEGQTQIPDTWRLEKEREESQPKRNGQNQQPDDEAATADSRA